jgi:radical SAM protein with 4Fe4S-binding SPASM domain
MNHSLVKTIPIQESPIWDKSSAKRHLYSFELELTARCPNNCRHCYVNLPANDSAAKKAELTLDEISRIADEAVSMGAIWCLITGGEPLLRDDFSNIYLDLKRKGLLVSVFTTAQILTEKHIELFRKYPPRDIEITVYGVTKETYERVTRKPGSFEAFMRGLNRILDAGIKVRFKAMALRSNISELTEIARFCREKTKDYFRFDPMLHLRFDGDPLRNEEIRAERLSPEEIVSIEQADTDRSRALQKDCHELINPEFSHTNCNHLFHCGAGNGSFYISYDGKLRLCSSLCHPDCTYDLRQGSLKEAWNDFIPKIRDMRSDDKAFLETCRVCPIINLCLWCPAHAYLETGRLDGSVSYFCEVAKARVKAILRSKVEGPMSNV